MQLVSVYDAFAPVYSDWSAEMTEDVPFYVELTRETDGPLSLLHLPTWRDRRRVFERVAASLRPGGRFAWNAFVFDPYGWFDRSPFADDSREFVWATRQPM